MPSLRGEKVRRTLDLPLNAMPDRFRGLAIGMNLTYKSEKAGGLKAKPKRRFSDLCTCRVRDIGMTTQFECLVATPGQCRFVLAYGDRFFCHHPMREEMARG